jgi:hypothetical protein
MPPSNESTKSRGLSGSTVLSWLPHLGQVHRRLRRRYQAGRSSSDVSAWAAAGSSQTLRVSTWWQRRQRRTQSVGTAGQYTRPSDVRFRIVRGWPELQWPVPAGQPQVGQASGSRVLIDEGAPTEKHARSGRTYSIQSGLWKKEEVLLGARRRGQLVAHPVTAGASPHLGASKEREASAHQAGADAHLAHGNGRRTSFRHHH